MGNRSPLPSLIVEAWPWGSPPCLITALCLQTGTGQDGWALLLVPTGLAPSASLPLQIHSVHSPSRPTAGPFTCTLLPQLALGLVPCTPAGLYQMSLLSETLPDRLVYDSSPCFLPYPFSHCSIVLHGPYHHCTHWSTWVPPTFPTKCKTST